MNAEPANYESSREPVSIAPARPPMERRGRHEILKHVIGLPRTSNRAIARAILPLRLFLGGTFVYAALDKLTDPAFFDATAPTYIGQQMAGYVRTGSPLSSLLTGLAIPHAAFFGALIALSELWVGMATLAGLLTRVSAVGGFALSLTFYLTSSWAIRPYYMGPDLPYALGWLTLGLAGPSLLSLDEYVFGAVLRARTVSSQPRFLARRVGIQEHQVPTRRSFVTGLGATVALMLGAGVIDAVARLLTPAPVADSITVRPTAGSSASKGKFPGTVLLGNVKALSANSARQYTDPRTGNPALLIHLSGGGFVAYSAVCTHAGCTVGYDPRRAQLVCPCHGSVYDPRHGARVVAGPAPQPLVALPVRVDAQGNAYDVGAALQAKPAQ